MPEDQENRELPEEPELPTIIGYTVLNTQGKEVSFTVDQLDEANNLYAAVAKAGKLPKFVTIVEENEE